MAGDWIKLEAITLEKPEIFALAEELNCTHATAFMACVRFWIWADRQSRNGHAINVTFVTLDSVASIAGFSAAMVKVGWLVVENGKVSLPNFERHNGNTAKKRALAQNRKANQRSRNSHAIGHASVTHSAGPEKRREEHISRGAEKPTSSGFDLFWIAYPKKKNRIAALKSWNKLKPDQSLTDRILKALQFAIQSGELGSGYDYYPYPATWLNGQRWEDEVRQAKPMRVAL